MPSVSKAAVAGDEEAPAETREETMRRFNSELQKADDATMRKAAKAFDGWKRIDGMELRFEDVNVKTKKGEHCILRDAWGVLPGSELGCIIGGSGSGKTTLLGCLASRLDSSVEATGRVYLAGTEYPSRRGFVGLVEQSDETLVATATCRESLMFAAKLRRPDDEDRVGVVESLLKALKLEDCADTMVGNSRLRGMSGGEKRRLSIALELVSRPRVIFLDEVTSGLDAANARSVVAITRVVSKTLGATCLATIHQPTSSMFFSHDRVFVMHRGDLVYRGTADGLSAHLESCGVVIPPMFSPADVVIDALAELGSEPLMQTRDDERLGSENVVAIEDADGAKGYRANAWTQFSLLSERRFLEIFRGYRFYLIRLIIGVSLTLVCGLLFYDAGARDDSKPENMQTHYGALTFLLIAAQQSASALVLIRIPQERPVFLREYRNRTYNYWVYYLVQQTAEWPFVIIEECLKNAIAFALFKLDANYFLICLITILLSASIAAMAAMISSTLNSVQAATSLLPVLLVPQMLFSGYFVRITQMPEIVRWARWLCALRYATSAAAIAEFGECNNNDTCSDFLATNRIHELTLAQNCTVLVVLIVVAQFVGSRALKNSAK